MSQITKSSLNIQKNMKISLIGGLSGGLEVIVAFILGLIVSKHFLTLDFIIGGLAFVIVGVGVALSLIVASPQLKKKTKLLIGGIIGGFIAGVFFHFGIGLYLGITIFSIIFAFLVNGLRILGVLKFFLGSVVGGFVGCILASVFLIGWSRVELLYPILHNKFSIITTIINTSIIIYFLNFGMLLSMQKGSKGDGCSRSLIR